MPTEKLSFPGHAGHLLDARLDLPDTSPVATALFAHCFTCSKDIAAARRISQRLAALGIAVLRFDFTGLGHSEGEFANTHFSSNIEDLIQAAHHLETLGKPVDLLIGHSLGGAAVLAAAAQIPTAKAIVTIGAPSDPAHVAEQFNSTKAEIMEKGQTEVTLAGRPFTIRDSFLNDISGQNLDLAISGLRRALLVLHSPVDQTVGIDNAAHIFTTAKHPKSFVTLDNADHLLSRPEDAEYAAGVIASWAIRYLEIRRPAAPIGAPEGVVRVSEADPKGFLQDICAGRRHHIQADEPAAYGGTDLGLTPYQLLSASLGSCTSMTIRMYARRKKWPLEHVRVDVTHDKIHATDCEQCLGDSEKVDQFTRRITLAGDLDDKQRDRLMQIADRCPVHRTLEPSAKIVTKQDTRQK